MHSAIIEPVCAHGGMAYYDSSLCRSLQNTGISVKFYTSQAGDIFPEDVPVLESFKGVFGTDPVAIRAARWIAGLRTTMQDAKKTGARCCHFHFFDSGPLQYLCVLYAKKYGFKTIATIHDVEPLHTTRSRWSASLLLSLLDGIIVHNGFSRNKLSELFDNRTKPVATIPHGHYLEYVGNRMAPLEARKRLGLMTHTGPLFLFFGQIKKAKGLDIALRALGMLRPTFPDVRLLIAGRLWKDEETGYRALMKEQGIEHMVSWQQRYIHPEEAHDCYYGCTAVLLPYRRISQSGVLLMAMSYGAPVVASDLPGMKDIVTHGRNGFLFQNDDPQSLADAMAVIIKNPEEAARVGREGTAYVRRYHDWDEIGRITAEFYVEVGRS